MSCQSQRSRTNLQRGYFLFFSFFKAKIFTVATMLSAIKSVISIFWNKFGILGLQESLITLVWSHFIFFILFFFLLQLCRGTLQRCLAVKRCEEMFCGLWNIWPSTGMRMSKKEKQNKTTELLFWGELTLKDQDCTSSDFPTAWGWMSNNWMFIFWFNCSFKCYRVTWANLYTTLHIL